MPTVGNRGKRLDLIIKQGSTLAPHLVRFMGKVSGLPIPITGSIVRGSVRKDIASSIAYPLSCSIVDGESGYLTFSMAHTITATIPYLGPYYDPANQYVWDLELELPSGFVMPVFYGNVKLFGEVTR